MANVPHRAFPRLALAAVLVTALACPLAALAQSAASPATPDARAASLRQQMTAEEFQAAGLGKLDAAELARLEAWLNRTVVVETEKAAVAERRRVEDDTRGFFNFGSTEPVVSRMSGRFRGYGRGREYTLDNGQVWKQMDDARLVGADLENPGVRITPSLVGNSWSLAVEGYNSRAKVQRIK